MHGTFKTGDTIYEKLPAILDDNCNVIKAYPTKREHCVEDGTLLTELKNVNRVYKSQGKLGKYFQCYTCGKNYKFVGRKEEPVDNRRLDATGNWYVPPQKDEPELSTVKLRKTIDLTSLYDWKDRRVAKIEKLLFGDGKARPLWRNPVGEIVIGVCIFVMMISTLYEYLYDINISGYMEFTITIASLNVLVIILMNIPDLIYTHGIAGMITKPIFYVSKNLVYGSVGIIRYIYNGLANNIRLAYVMVISAFIITLAKVLYF